MTDPAPTSHRFERVVIAVVYVIPLTAAVVFLAGVGLPALALALLAVEAGVSAAVVVAKRREGTPLSRLAVALAVLAVLAGAGAAALVTGTV